jgi:hypothetical protein
MSRIRPGLSRAVLLCLSTVSLSMVFLGWARHFQPEGVSAYAVPLAGAFVLGVFTSLVLGTRSAPLVGGVLAALMYLCAMVINALFFWQSGRLISDGIEVLVLVLGLYAAAGVLGGLAGLIARLFSRIVGRGPS